jgi:hypothetical protein
MTPAIRYDYSTSSSQRRIAFSLGRLIWLPFAHWTSPVTFLWRAVSLRPTPLPPDVQNGMIFLPLKS